MMHITAKKQHNGPLSDRLNGSGLRLTPQRDRVYSVLLEKRNHPTAEEVFIRAKQQMPDISLATVYNCLDTLVKCGLARQVNLERGATRYCPNMQEHCHFYCDGCHGVFDLGMPAKMEAGLPKGFKAQRFDVTIHGLCPACSNPME